MSRECHTEFSVVTTANVELSCAFHLNLLIKKCMNLYNSTYTRMTSVVIFILTKKCECSEMIESIQDISI